MKQPPIIVIVNKKPYTLTATDIEAMRDMPDQDRQQLITLLEAIKRQGNVEHAATQQSAARVNAATPARQTSAAPIHVMNSERLASGDVDAVMAQLIMEEKLKQKPALTKQTVHKWTAIIAAIVFLLVLIL